MQSDYTDKDTDQVRVAEHSSAGVKTQNLSSLPGIRTQYNDPPQPLLSAQPDQGVTPIQRNNPIGIVLIVLGMLAFLSQFGPDREAMTGGMVLFTIASCFLFFAFWKRIYGLLIPGSILTGLSLGVSFADITNGVSVLWGLALGFLGILFLGRSLFGVNNQWPIYPAIPLFAVGVIVAFSSMPSVLAGSVMGLPLLLIGLGLYLGWGRRAA